MPGLGQKRAGHLRKFPVSEFRRCTTKASMQSLDCLHLNRTRRIARLKGNRRCYWHWGAAPTHHTGRLQQGEQKGVQTAESGEVERPLSNLAREIQRHTQLWCPGHHHQQIDLQHYLPLHSQTLVDMAHLKVCAHHWLCFGHRCQRTNIR